MQCLELACAEVMAWADRCSHLWCTVLLIAFKICGKEMGQVHIYDLPE